MANSGFRDFRISGYRDIGAKIIQKLRLFSLSTISARALPT